MNSARVEAEYEDGTVNVLKQEVLDPLDGLWTPGNHPHARVGMNVGTQVDFGRIKIAAYVEYECDQKTAVVDKVGGLSFHKAFEFMNDGLTILGGK